MAGFKDIWFFHLGDKISQGVADKLNEAKKAIEASGYKVITIFSNSAEKPELQIEGKCYPYTGDWIDLFISECEKSFAKA